MKTITYEEYDEHCCTASPEDGCKVCEEWQVQQQVANDIKFDAHKEESAEQQLFKSHEIQHRLINSLIK